MCDCEQCFADNVYRPGADPPPVDQCADERFPIGEGEARSAPRRVGVRRGAQSPNPVRPVFFRLWRGTGEGVQPTRHGQSGIVHDFGPGRNGVAPLFFANSYDLGEQYSRLQGRGGGSRPIVYLWQGTWGDLSRQVGRDVQILDLGQGEVGRQWQRYVNERVVGSRTRLDYIRMGSHADSPAYWSFFQEFLRTTNRNLETYDVIIGPEYIRNGTQISIRDSQIQRIVQSQWQEYVRNPVWVRVVGSRGVPIDVDINHPDAGEANRRYVRERQEAMDRRLAQASGGRRSPLAPAPTRTPVVTPGATRGVAGILAAVEIARVILELVITIRSMPSEFQNKMREPGRKQRFWREYGVRSVIAAMVTGGDSKVGTDGQTRSSRGRVLHGLIPEDWDDVDADDLEFYLSAVDAVRNRSSDNPLDRELNNLCKLVRFLADGWRVAAVVPHRRDTRSNTPISRWTWHVRVKRPQSEGSYQLTNQHFSIRIIINRIRDILMNEERTRIQADATLVTPAGSLPQGRNGGAASQTIYRNAILRYSDNNDRPFYSVMHGRKLGDEDNWGDFEPLFYQVGATDIGEPFTIDDAFLVTGANPETNEYLLSILARNDSRALVTGYQDIMSQFTTVGPPNAWVTAPVAYVDVDRVMRSTL